MSEQEVFDYIYSVITREYLENRIQKKENFGITAKDIADHFNTYRSTVSTMLNTAVKNGLFIKIETRPVLFVPVDIIKKELHVPLEKSVYTPEEIRDLFFKKEQEVDSFSIMIGYDGSQSLQIKQAQSAILYPPKGLHTLITGESGTGKTLFAHTMYDYGRKIKGMSEKEYPFVEFNCADYYHNPQLLLSQLFGHIRGALPARIRKRRVLLKKRITEYCFSMKFTDFLRRDRSCYSILWIPDSTARWGKQIRYGKRISSSLELQQKIRRMSC